MNRKGPEMGRTGTTGRAPNRLLRRSKAWIFAATLSGILWMPSLAQACAVCFSGRSDETRAAFVSTTAFMTFLPMLLIGGAIWWFRRRVLAMQEAERERALKLVRSD